MTAVERERWSQLRVLIDRGSTGKAYVTVVLRKVDGRDRRDLRLGTWTLELPPGSQESSSWADAVRAAMSLVSGGSDPTYLAGGPGAP